MNIGKVNSIDHSTAIVTACMNRNDNLRQVIPSWLNSNSVQEIIVVDWSSKEPVKSTLSDYVKDSRLKIVRVEGEKSWILTHAFNLAAKITSQKNILKIDCDIEIDHDFLDKHKLQQGCFYAGDWRDLIPGVTGLFLISKKDFLSVGGFNEFILTYGWDDIDLYKRLETHLSLVRKKIDVSSVRHINHTEEESFKNQTKNTRDISSLKSINVSPETIQSLSQEREFQNIKNSYISRLIPWDSKSPQSTYKIIEKYPTGSYLRISRISEVPEIPESVILQAEYCSLKFLLGQYGFKNLPKNVSFFEMLHMYEMVQKSKSSNQSSTMLSLSGLPQANMRDKGKMDKPKLTNLCLEAYSNANYIEVVRICRQIPEEMRTQTMNKAFGISLYHLKLYEEAIEIFSELVKWEPENPALYYRLGQNYAGLREYDLSIRCCKRAIQLGLNSEEAFNLLCYANQELGWLCRCDPAAFSKKENSVRLLGIHPYLYVGPSVALVGNSSSIVGKQQGHLIDACDDIIRFNAFTTRGYELDVGYRTTIAVAGANLGGYYQDPEKLDIHHISPQKTEELEFSDSPLRVWDALEFLEKNKDCKIITWRGDIYTPDHYRANPKINRQYTNFNTLSRLNPAKQIFCFDHSGRYYLESGLRTNLLLSTLGIESKLSKGGLRTGFKIILMCVLSGLKPKCFGFSLDEDIHMYGYYYRGGGCVASRASSVDEARNILRQNSSHDYLSELKVLREMRDKNLIEVF